MIERMFDTSTSADSLEAQVIETELLIGRLRAHQLGLLRAIDQAQVPTADGCRTLAEWAAGRLDLDPDTAQSLVCAARASRAHPAITAALAEGLVSFDRAHTTLRLAEAGADPHTVRLSAGLDIPGLKRLVARHRRHTPRSHQEAFEARHLVLQPNLDESSWRVHGLLPGYEGRIVEKALTEKADELPNDPDLPRESRAARTADALAAICAQSLAGSHSGSADTPTVTLHVDARTFAASHGEAGTTIEGGPIAGRQILERVLCTGTLDVQAITRDGVPLAVGRTTRVIPPRLRRHVAHRDGGCTADGCTSRYRLQAHHVVPWSEGGGTDPDNLTTLCWYHHHVVVHGRGFRIDPTSPPTRRRFIPTGHRDPP